MERRLNYKYGMTNCIVYIEILCVLMLRLFYFILLAKNKTPVTPFYNTHITIYKVICLHLLHVYAGYVTSFQLK